MKTVTRSLLLSYSPISSDQLVELYRHCGIVEATVDIYIESIDDVEDDKTRTQFSSISLFGNIYISLYL